MLSVSDVMPMLLEAAPGFRHAWTAHLQNWGDDEPGAFNNAAEFGRYVVECLASGTTSEFPAVFRVIERLLVEGDREARAVATIGVLEDIQTIASHYDFGSAAFEVWLGPRSLEAWGQIERLWETGGGSLTGVLRLEQRMGDTKKRDCE